MCLIALLAFGCCKHSTPNDASISKEAAIKKAVAQQTEFQIIDNALTGTYKTLKKRPDLRCDSLAPLFKKQIIRHLINPLTFENSFDSLSKYISIEESADKRIKFYSWNEVTGGSHLNFASVAQFRTSNGQIRVKEINSDETASHSVGACIINQVHDINLGKENGYLIFGWGTWGSGNQHRIIQIYTIQDDKLVKCRSLLNNRDDIVIEYRKRDKLNLTFNAATNEISYNEYEQGEEATFHERTGRVITLKLKNGKFYQTKSVVLPFLLNHRSSQILNIYPHDLQKIIHHMYCCISSFDFYSDILSGITEGNYNTKGKS